MLAFSFSLIYNFIADNISILMYIMCVILCVFSALSRRLGALQMSIIVIIMAKVQTTTKEEAKHPVQWALNALEDSDQRHETGDI